MKTTLLWLTFLKWKLCIECLIKATKEDQRILFSFLIPNKLYIFKLWPSIPFVFWCPKSACMPKKTKSCWIGRAYMVKIDLYSSPVLICIYDVDDYAQKQRLSKFYRRWAWKNWGFLISKAIFRYVSQIS